MCSERLQGQGRRFDSGVILNHEGYVRKLRGKREKMMANAGVEPTTLALLAPRSNQLS